MKTIRVRTLPRTMSGRRGGLEMDLEPGTAKDWIAKGWVVLAGDQDTTPILVDASKTKVVKGAAALALVLLMSLSSSFAAATRFEMVTSGAVASSNSSAFQLTTSTNLFVGVDVTSCAGTPGTFDIWLQASDDGGTTWYDYPADYSQVGTGASSNRTSGALGAPIRNITGTAGHAVTTANKYGAVYKNIAADRVRLIWLVATFTSCTFSASAVAK